MSDNLQQAITAIKSDDKEIGKRLLMEVLKSDQHSEIAWLWMTQAVNSDDERIKCLQNVLEINPDNEAAKRGLAILQEEQASQSQQVEPPRLETSTDELSVKQKVTSQQKLWGVFRQTVNKASGAASKVIRKGTQIGGQLAQSAICIHLEPQYKIQY